MAQYIDKKKRDVGYKYSSGILSTDPDFAWFSEQFGLSPNQLASDLWAQAVPFAASGGADTAIQNISYINKKNVTLFLEPNTNGTLWFARDNSDNRMRNFINPNNHLDAAGNISVGYTIKLFESNDDGTKNDSAQINTTHGAWQFFYKEGALVLDDTYTVGSTNLSPDYNASTQSPQRLHAEVYQYEGITFQPNNNPTNGQVISYNSTSGNLAWVNDNNTFRTIQVDTDGDGIANNTLEASENLILKKGNNITLSEAGGVINISATNTQNTYSISIPSTTTKLELSGGGTTDNIEFVGSGATTVNRTDASKFTIDSTDTQLGLHSSLTDVLTLTSPTTGSQALSATSAGNDDLIAGWNSTNNKFTFLTQSEALAVLGNPITSLPTASTSTKGGVKVGTGLGISSEVLSVDINGISSTMTSPVDDDKIIIHNNGTNSIQNLRITTLKAYVLASGSTLFYGRDDESIVGDDDVNFTMLSDRDLIFHVNKDGDALSDFKFLHGASSGTEVAKITNAGNLEILGDLQVKGDNIKGNSNSNGISFDSSGNTTIAGDLAISGNVTGTVNLTGSVTGNISLPSSGSLTLPSASTIKDSSNNKIVAPLTRTIDGASKTFTQVTNLEIEGSSEGRIFGPTDNDLIIRSEKNLIFQVDADNDSTNNFTFKDGGNNTIASLTEAGVLTLNSALPIASGGTGISSVSGNADRFLKVNSSANAFQLVDPTELVQDIVGAMFTSNTETRISATYQDSDGTIDLVVDDMSDTLELAPSSASDPAAGVNSSIIIKEGNTTTVAGKVYYFAPNGAWVLANAGDTGTMSGLLGVAVGTNSTTNGMTTNGIITISGHAAGSAGVGKTIYLSETDGTVTTTAPSNVRILGSIIKHHTGADNNNCEIYFNPDNFNAQATNPPSFAGTTDKLFVFYDISLETVGNTTFPFTTNRVDSDTGTGAIVQSGHNTDIVGDPSIVSIDSTKAVYVDGTNAAFYKSAYFGTGGDTSHGLDTYGVGNVSNATYPNTTSVENTGFTIECWWRSNGSFTNNGNLWAFYKNDGIRTRFSSSGVRSFIFQNNSSGAAAFGTSVTYSTDTWYHDVTTVSAEDGSNTHTVNLYQNGNQTPVYTTTQQISWDVYVRDRILFGGAYYSGSTVNEAFKGYYGIIRVYQKPLTAQEVENNYNVEKSRYGY